MLAFIGDVLLGEHILANGRGFKSLFLRNPHRVVHYLKNLVSMSELNNTVVLANVETPISNKCAGKSFCAPNSMSSLLKILNISIANIANNHILDYGLDAFYDTVENLEKLGITVCGLREKEKYILLNIKGYKFYVYCLYASISKVEAKKLYKNNINAYYLYEPTFLKNLLLFVNYCKERNAIPIIFIHWGYEYMNNISPYQLKILDILLRNGNIILVGHHPHVIQDFFQVNNSIVVSSLGNFIFDYLPYNSYIGMIAEVEVEQDCIQGYYRIFSISKSIFMPLLLSKRYRLMKRKLPKVNISEEKYKTIHKKLLKRLKIFNLREVMKNPLSLYSIVIK